MQDLLYLVGWNQLVALAMAAAVWIFSQTRFLRRRPAVLHGLWLLVLLTLVTPSIAFVPVAAGHFGNEKGLVAAGARVVVPANRSAVGFGAARWSSGAGPASANTLNAGCCAPAVSSVSPMASATASDSPEVAGDSSHISSRGISFAVVGFSLAVTCLLWIVAVRQLVQTRRLLRRSGVASGRVAELLCEVAQSFGMRSAATLHVADAPVSPMLWAWPGSAVIVVTRRLIDSLDENVIRIILAHELAHLMRRDHWTNMFALAIATLFWWNPMVWFVRGRLSAASEASCDALALERLGGSRRRYAETLLDVVDSLAFAPARRSAFAMPFGEARSLKERFEMIADHDVKPRTTRGGWILLGVGLVCSIAGSAWAADAFVTAEPSNAVPEATALPLMCCPALVSVPT